MNCCDEYGNCKQGRNCPARKQMTDGRMLRLEEKYAAWVTNNGLALLFVIGALPTVIIGGFWMYNHWFH